MFQFDNLQHWKDFIAAAPELQNGKWIDRETGREFDPTKTYSAKYASESKHAQRAVEARMAAKFFGGKALKGTPKQRSWAEDIRKEFLSMELDSKIVEFFIHAPECQNAKYWIENRNEIIKGKGAPFTEKAKLFADEREEEREESATFEGQLKEKTKVARFNITPTSKLTLEKVITSEMSNEKHPAEKKPSITIDGVEIHIIRIPTLKKSLIACEHDGHVYHGYTAK